ncbi:MAG: hypothetical protein OD811_05705, partial [Alphaproteobacteria bacterium]
GTISLPTLRDSAAERVGETFTVRIGSVNLGLATVGAANETLVTLNDKTLVLLTLKDGAAVADAEYLEGDAASKVITIEVSLSENLRPAESSAPAVGDVVVDLQLTLPGGVTISDPGDVTFATGAGLAVQTRTITIPVGIDNNLNEGSREIKVKGVASTSGRDDEFDATFEPEETLTILDDDAILTLSVDSATVVEGGTVRVMVAVMNPVGVALSVPVVGALSGSASSADFSATQGAALGSLAISIPRGGMSGTVDVTNLDDRLVEGDETFSVNFGTLSGVLSAVGGSVARTITITDNDTASLAVSHAPADPSVGAAVTFSGVLAVAGSGIGTDGIAVGNNGSVEFEVDDPAGMLAATLTFTDGNSDSVLSGAELSVDGSPTWPAAVVGGNADVDFSVALKGTLPAQLTDARFTNGTAAAPVVERVAVAFPRISFASASETVAEGVGAARIAVAIAPALGAAGDVDFAYGSDSDAATADAVAADYNKRDGSLGILAGVASRTLAVTITDDVVIEGDEVFTATLSVRSGQEAAYAIGTPGVVAVTIDDNDDDVGKLDVSLVLSGSGEEVAELFVGERLKLKATLRAGAGGSELMAAEDIEVMPGAFSGLWGGTTAPAAFTITAGNSSEESAEFVLANTEGGVVALPVATFTPDIGEFKSADDVLAKQITLPNPDLIATFNIVDSLRVPRVAPYIYPFDIVATSTETQTQSADAAVRNLAVTQTLTIETSQAAPAGGWEFALAASTAGVASGEVAPPASYMVPATLTIDAGDTTGKVDITLTPSVLSAAPHNFYPATMYLALQAAGRTIPTGAVRRFVVEATPPEDVASGVSRVGFAFADSVGISQRGARSTRYVGYSSSLVEVEQGGVALFRVINASSRAGGGTDPLNSLTYPFDHPGNLGEVPAAIPLPVGVSFHFRTEVPKATPDVASGANFALPGPGAEGEEALVLVQAAMDAPITIGTGVSMLPLSKDYYGRSDHRMKSAPHHDYVSMNSDFRIKVVAARAVAVPSEFDFVDETSGEPRTWPYVGPYEVVGGSQVVVIALDEAAPAGGLRFGLSASVAGLSDPAPSAVYAGVPDELLVSAGEKIGKARINVDVGSLSGLGRFYVVASPPAGITGKTTGANRVEFILGAPAGAGGRDITFYPATLTVPQGSSDSFTVINLVGGNNDPVGFIEINTATPKLDAGITLTSPDGTTSAGAADKFKVQAPESDGESLSIMVDVAMDVPLTSGTPLILTKDSNDANDYFYDSSRTGIFSEAAGLSLEVIPAGPTVEFVSGTATIGEGGRASLAISLSAPLASSAVVDVSFGVDSDSVTADAGGDDHTFSGTTFTLPAGATRATLPIPTAADNVIEGDEVLVVSLGRVSGGLYGIGARGSVSLTITDTTDAVAKLRIGLVASGAEGVELTRPTFGQAVKLRAFLHRSGSVGSLLTASEAIDVTPGAFAAAWGDTVFPSGVITILAGESAGVSAEFNVLSRVLGRLAIVAPAFTPDIGDFESSADAEASSQITLPAKPTLSVSSVLSIAEGVSGDVVVTLSERLSADISGTYVLAGVGAATPVQAEATDYTDPVSKAFTITAGQTTATISLATTDDNIVEA